MPLLIASCIRQNPHILHEFLEGLDCLEKPKDSSYFFVLNSLDFETEKMFWSWADGKPVETERAEFGVPYNCDEETHRWTVQLVDCMIQMKNRILEKAVGYDWLLFVDSDTYLHPKTLMHLLSRGKDIISEISWTRWFPNDPEMPNCWFFDHYGFPPDGLERLRNEELVKVGGFGGLYLISKKALMEGVSFKRLENLNPMWGEDRSFAVRAQSLGFELYVDTKLPSFHIYRLTDLPRLVEWKKNGYKIGQILPSQPNNDKVLIAVPHTGTIKADTVSWLVKTIAGNPTQYGFYPHYGLPTDSNRNQIVKFFLTDKQAEPFNWLLFLDSDNFPVTPNAVEKLLSHNKKIISAVCWSCMGGEKGGEWEFDPLPYPVVMKRAEDGKGWKVAREKIVSGQPLIEVDATGASFLLIHRSILEKIGKSPFRFGYDDWGIVNVVGEDFSFCQKIKSLPEKIYVDLTVRCGHLKELDLQSINNLLQKMELQKAE